MLPRPQLLWSSSPLPTPFHHQPRRAADELHRSEHQGPLPQPRCVAPFVAQSCCSPPLFNQGSLVHSCVLVRHPPVLRLRRRGTFRLPECVGLPCSRTMLTRLVLAPFSAVVAPCLLLLFATLASLPHPLPLLAPAVSTSPDHATIVSLLPQPCLEPYLTLNQASTANLPSYVVDMLASLPSPVCLPGQLAPPWCKIEESD